jgi:hypothetical protein
MLSKVEVHPTTKTTTVVGLVFEGFGLLTMVLGVVFLQILSTLSVDELMQAGFTESDALIVLWIGAIVRLILLVLSLIVGIFFVVNIVLFSKMIRNLYDRETTEKVLLYQAIWGGVNLVFNQLAGICYLISGLTGRTAIKEPVRPGL